MNCVIYCRTSTDEQHPENQIPALEKWIAERDYTLVVTYSENASAWKAGHQKELSRLFKELPQTGAKFCLVWALDRLTREGPLRELTLVEEFSQRGVKLVSLQEPWTDYPTDFTPVMHALTGVIR